MRDRLLSGGWRFKRKHLGASPPTPARTDGGGISTWWNAARTDQQLKRQVLAVWNRWPDQADYDRRHDAYGVQALAFLFEQQVAGQVRGVSWLAPILLSSRDLDDFNRATVVKHKAAALLTGFITTPNDNPLAAARRRVERSPAHLNACAGNLPKGVWWT